MSIYARDIIDTMTEEANIKLYDSEEGKCWTILPRDEVYW
jgi:hypothetical protein